MAETEEGTALGAAILGGMAADVYADLSDALSTVEQKRRIIEPDADLIESYSTIIDRYDHVYPARKPLNARIANPG